MDTLMDAVLHNLVQNKIITWKDVKKVNRVKDTGGGGYILWGRSDCYTYSTHHQQVFVERVAPVPLNDPIHHQPFEYVAMLKTYKHWKHHCSSRRFSIYEYWAVRNWYQFTTVSLILTIKKCTIPLQTNLKEIRKIPILKLQLVLKLLLGEPFPTSGTWHL